MESELSANIPAPFGDMSGDGSVTRLRRSDLDEIPSLVERAKGGDKEAFGQLYRAYHAPIYRLAGFHFAGMAEDVVAETFTRAWKALPRYKDRGVPFKAWLYAIARNVVADEHRRLQRVRRLDQLPEQVVDPVWDSSVDLGRAIQALPDEQRRVIEMKYLMGMANPEVAQQLKKSIGAVNALQWRALKAMRSALEEAT